MRTIITIGVIILLVVLLTSELIKRWNKIVFSFSFKGVDLSALDLNSLLSSGQTQAKLLLGMKIKNDNSFSIPIKNTNVMLYYEDTLIAESSGNLSAQSFKVLANSDKIMNVGSGVVVDEITDYVNVRVNSASAKLVKEAVSKKNPKVNYTVKIKVFGIPLTYKDYFTAST